MAQRKPIVFVGPCVDSAEPGLRQQRLEIRQRVLVAVFRVDALPLGKGAAPPGQCTVVWRLASRCISMRDSVVLNTA